MNGPALVVLSGLPGAGKTTFAAAWAQHGGVVVARDALRVALALDCETTLTLVMAALARTLLHAGRDVAIDAPNLAEWDRRVWHDVATATGARLHWQHLATSLADCIARDAARAISVGADLIRGMAATANIA